MYWYIHECLRSTFSKTLLVTLSGTLGVKKKNTVTWSPPQALIDLALAGCSLGIKTFGSLGDSVLQPEVENCLL